MEKVKNWIAQHPEKLRPKQWGPGRPTEEFWSRLEGWLAEKDAGRSKLVRAIADGSAPREALRAFAKDLVFLSKELPTVEGRIAALLALHSEASSIMMAYMPCACFGYVAHPYLPDLARRFAGSVGVPAEELDPPAPSDWSRAYTMALYNLGVELMEMGVAGTMVDAQWKGLAPRLKAGLTSHYGVSREDAAVFDALGDMDGPREEYRPILIKDLGQSGYHQFIIEHGLREVSTIWYEMWESWLR